MKAEQFTLQSYEGGPEYRFFNRMPFVLRADIELAGDTEFEALSPVAKASVRAVAMCVLAVRKEGLAKKLGAPGKLTVDSLMAFAENYMIEVKSDAEIPTGEDVVENPTGTPAAA